MLSVRGSVISLACGGVRFTMSIEILQQPLQGEMETRLRTGIAMVLA